jgi:outer membrane protein TolC
MQATMFLKTCDSPLACMRCGFVLLMVMLGAAVCSAAEGQSPSEMVTGPTRPTQVPLSGRESGSGGTVSVTQRTTNSGGGNTVNVINSSVTAQSPYDGSVPAPKLTDGVLSLTLADALSMGLRENLGALTESASIQQAQGARQVAKSELMPQLNTAISEVFERLNLRTDGVEISSFPESVKFNYFDARAARLNQSVFDLVRIRNLHSASANLSATIHAARNARDLIVLAVGGSYLQLIATQARIDATAAEVVSAQAVCKQAADRLEAGLATRVDVTRSQVQLQTEQQRLRSLQADLDTEKLRLARIIGLALGQQFSTSDKYVYAPVTDFTLDSALPKAFSDRSDLKAAAAGVKAAEDGVKAAHAERLPNLSVSADFGAAGITPTHESTGVYTVSGTLIIPLYEGGRIHGDIDQAAAALKQRKAEFEDVRGQIDQDVRQAFIDLGSAADQVDVAKSNVGLAHETLTQSRDRFAAGIADTVEVVQAEQAVVQADDDYITAVYEHNLAKVSLARAMGNAEQTLPQLLRK